MEEDKGGGGDGAVCAGYAGWTRCGAGREVVTGSAGGVCGARVQNGLVSGRLRLAPLLRVYYGLVVRLPYTLRSATPGRDLPATSIGRAKACKTFGEARTIRPRLGRSPPLSARPMMNIHEQDSEVHR